MVYIKKNIKLVITDLDNTLLRSDKTVSDYTLNVIRECEKQGIIFGIATARSERTAKKYIDVIKPKLMISNGGALAKYNGEVIFESMLSELESHSLLQDCLNSEHIGEITVETRDCYYRNNKERIESDKEYINAKYTDYREPLNCPVYKITCEVLKNELVDELLEKYPNVCYVPFRGELWGRFAHKNGHKVDAIKAVASHFNINYNEIICFGDDSNDISMISHYFGVAVENAIVTLKEVANDSTLSNDKDGVAYYLESKIL